MEGASDRVESDGVESDGVEGDGVEPEDHGLARRLAEEAGRRLVALRERTGFADPGGLRDEGDRSSHDFLLGALAAQRPGDRVLSEEDDAGHEDDVGHEDAGHEGGGGREDAAGSREGGGATRVWIVDPLDGTREFSEEGRVDWAVHVALVVGGAPVAGAVALPARGLVLSTADPPALGAAGDPPRVLVSRTRRPRPVLELAEALGAELVELGSAGAKTAAVVLGEADVYAHTGGQYEWDSAAPVAVARAAGLHTSRLDGGELVYDRPEPWLPDLLVCRPELADRVLEVTRLITGADGATG